MANVKGELKLISRYASVVTTQVEQVLKAQNDLLNELNNKKNDNVVRVMTRGGKMTQEPLYPEGHQRELSKILTELILMHLVLLRTRKRKMIELCMLLVNLLFTNLRIPMIFLFLMLKLSLVMNTHLMILKKIMMRFMKTLNQQMIKNQI